MAVDADVDPQESKQVQSAAERIGESEDSIPLLDESAFVSTVLNHPEPSLVIFYLETCAVCHALFVRLSRLVASVDHTIRVFRIDAEMSRDLAVRRRISTVPALLVFSGGQERSRLEGLIPQSALCGLVDSIH